MEDFYRAMTTYIDSKKTKKICYHEHTIKKYGWKICFDCGLYLNRIFCNDIYSELKERCLIKPKEDRLPKIREIMTDMMYSVTRKKDMLNGIPCYNGPLEDGLPRELFDHMRELCMKCMDLEENVKCHRRSLCAALLWDKIKSLYPSLITLTKFSKRVGVFVPTIKKLMKSK